MTTEEITPAGLPAAASADDTHIIPAMKAGVAEGLTVAQIVARAVAVVLDGSPAALDTLNELAAALGDDENFAATMTTALAGKQPLDALLTAIAGLSTGDGKFLAFTGADTAAVRDIVGTVSQSGGVPTGAIIETGTNANGRYIKWADGTQVCIASVTPASNDNGGTALTWPAAFSGTPDAFPMLQAPTSASGGTTGSYVTEVNGVTSTGAKVKALSLSPPNSLAYDVVSIRIATFAIGRWF